MTEITREDVWIALSDLYLDTDIEPFLEPCAQLLADSAFSREELQHMLLDEVHPALVTNLLSVAGEWGSFDRDWLCARLRQKRSAWHPRVWLARRIMRGYARTQWQRLDEIIVRLRSAQAAV